MADGRVLVRNGVWQVPPEERPSQWRLMNIKEPVQVFAAPSETAVALLDPSLGEIAPLATTAMANSPGELPGLHDSLAPWARTKLEDSRREHQDLVSTIRQAKAGKWNYRTLAASARKVLSRVTFYEKVLTALECGYMLFPPVPNADAIAIRLDRTWPLKNMMDTNQWQRPNTTERVDDPLPMGEGAYLNPVAKWFVWKNFKTDKGEERKEWHASDLDAPDFPLMMAKPEIIEATNAAMELKVFDEIRMFPFTQRKGDPCLLGAIVEKYTGRRHYFLISWRVDARDI